MKWTVEHLPEALTNDIGQAVNIDASRQPSMSTVLPANLHREQQHKKHL
jgi:hypothetical protein